MGDTKEEKKGQEDLDEIPIEIDVHEEKELLNKKSARDLAAEKKE